MENAFKKEIIERFKMPWKQPAFRYYFYWIVIAFGSLGIIITCFEEANKNTPIISNISHCIATTFIALIAGSLVDLNLSFKIRNIPSLIINSIAFIGLSILLLYLSFKIENCLSLIPAIIGYLISLVIWILANADNERLSDKNYYEKMLENSPKLTQDFN